MNVITRIITLLMYLSISGASAQFAPQLNQLLTKANNTFATLKLPDAAQKAAEIQKYHNEIKEIGAIFSQNPEKYKEIQKLFTAFGKQVQSIIEESTLLQRSHFPQLRLALEQFDGALNDYQLDHVEYRNNELFNKLFSVNAFIAEKILEEEPFVPFASFGDRLTFIKNEIKRNPGQAARYATGGIVVGTVVVWGINKAIGSKTATHDDWLALEAEFNVTQKIIAHADGLVHDNLANQDVAKFDKPVHNLEHAVDEARTKKDTHFDIADAHTRAQSLLNQILLALKTPGEKTDGQKAQEAAIRIQTGHLLPLGSSILQAGKVLAGKHKAELADITKIVNDQAKVEEVVEGFDEDELIQRIAAIQTAVDDCSAFTPGTDDSKTPGANGKKKGDGGGDEFVDDETQDKKIRVESLASYIEQLLTRHIARAKKLLGNPPVVQTLEKEAEKLKADFALATKVLDKFDDAKIAQVDLTPFKTEYSRIRKAVEDAYKHKDGLKALRLKIIDEPDAETCASMWLRLDRSSKDLVKGVILYIPKSDKDKTFDKDKAIEITIRLIKGLKKLKKGLVGEGGKNATVNDPALMGLITQLTLGDMKADKLIQKALGED